MDRKSMMLYMSAIAVSQLINQPHWEVERATSPLQMRDRKMISKAERAQRNKVKSIAAKSRKRNRR